MGMILRRRQFGIVFEYFCRIDVGLWLFLSEEKREEELNLKKIFVQKGESEKGNWTWNNLFK